MTLLSKSDCLAYQNQLKQFNVIIFDSIDSTNTYAKQLIQDTTLLLPTVIATTKQTAGYGKEARPFYSAEGLYLTLVMPVKNLKKLNPGLTTLSTGVSVVKTLEKYCLSQTFQLKWVNDILLDNKKCGGILAELVQKENDYYLVLGIGLNINTPQLPDNLQSIATTVTAKKCNLNHLLADLTITIYDNLETINAPSLISTYKNYSNLLGQRITITSRNNTHVGIVNDFDEKGGLVLRDETTKELATFYSGDVLKVSY